jgi:hypothetical protein
MVTLAESNIITQFTLSQGAFFSGNRFVINLFSDF